MPTTERDIKLPFVKSHAFLIGIDDYEHVSPLSTAINDAKGLARVLAEDHDYLVHPPLLNPTGAELIQWLCEDMPRLVGEGDRVFIYFAGHGIALDSDTNPRGYLVPADAQPGEPESLVAMDLFHQTIVDLPCQHGMIILDCCFAGSFRWSTGYRDIVFDLPSIIYEERFYQYTRDPAWQVITSSASDQKAVDVLSNQALGMRSEEGVEHSPFAQALIAGIGGEADTIPKDREDGVITATELYSYLRDRVEDETSEQGRRQSPSFFSLQEHDKGQYIFLNPRHPLNLPPLPRRNPYMGLASYDEKDRNFFYGRDGVIEALMELAQHQRLIVVSGASGTGKSSVIKAGLLPKLREAGWDILPPLRPGQEPLRELRANTMGLAERLADQQQWVLVVDQYEELITQCLDADDAVAFEEQLREWLLKYPTLRIVISVRSDFEPQFTEGPLAGWWNVGQYTIPAFTPQEIREVILKPTIQEVLFFEPATLVDKLVDAVNQAPGAMPLLSFTLSELYHAYVDSGRTDRSLTLEDYECLGGVVGALRTRANTIYDSLDDIHRQSMRQLMLRMVSLEGSDLAGRRVLASELTFKNKEATARIDRVARQLVAARLVSTGLDPWGSVFYEPGHDALVRAWGRLWEWVRNEGESILGLRYKLTIAVADYQEHEDEETANKYLWKSDPRLDLLYADLRRADHSYNLAEESFLRKSMRLRRRQQRVRQVLRTVTFLFLLIVSLVATWYAIAARKAEVAAKKATHRAELMTMISEKSKKEAIISAKGANVAARKAEQEREKAERQTELAKAATLQARAAIGEALRQANIAETHQLSNRAERLAEDNHFSSALFTASQAYRKALAPRPPVTYATFQDIFTAGVGQKVPVVVADLNGHLANVFQFAAAGSGLVLSRGSVRADFSPDGNYLLSYTQGPTAKVWDRHGKLLAELRGHADQITSACFAPDGRYVLTSSADRTGKLWDLKGRVVAELRGHRGSVFAARFSPDGRFILTYSRDRTAKLWNRKGKLLADLTLHTGQLTAAEFSPDGNFLLTSAEDGIAIIWDRLGNLVTELTGHTAPVLSAQFSPNGRYVVTGSEDQTAIVWNLQGERMATLAGHTDIVLDVHFAPDSWHLLTRSRDATVRVWDKNGRLLADLDQHTQAITSAAFSPRVEYVLTTSADSTAKLWRLSDKSLINLDQHTAPVTSAAFSPMGPFVITGAEDQTAKLWNFEGDLLADLAEHTGGVTAVDFSPDGYHVTTCSEDLTAKVWEVFRSPFVRFSAHAAALTAIGNSPDGSLLLTSSRDHVTRLWDRQGLQLAEGTHGKKVIETARFSPDGQRVLLLAKDHTAELWAWSEQDFSLLAPLDASVVSATFASDGQLILTGSETGSVQLWGRDGRLLANLEGHTERVNGVAFSPDGRYLLTGSDDLTAKLWRRDGGLLTTLTGHTEAVTSVSFAPDGKSLLTSSDDATAKSWSLRGKLLSDLAGHTGAVKQAQFSPDGRYILTLAATATAKLWDLRGRLIADLDRHTDELNSARFSADGELILTSSWDGTAKLWDLRGNLLADLDQHGKGVIDATFTGDGSSILTGSADRTAILWPLPATFADWVAERMSSFARR